MTFLNDFIAYSRFGQPARPVYQRTFKVAESESKRDPVLQKFLVRYVFALAPKRTPHLKSIVDSVVGGGVLPADAGRALHSQISESIDDEILVANLQRIPWMHDRSI